MKSSLQLVPRESWHVLKEGRRAEWRANRRFEGGGREPGWERGKE